MAFSEDIKKEFIEEIPHKTCCRRALVYGILFDAFVDGDRVYIDTASEEHADFYKQIFECFCKLKNNSNSEIIEKIYYSHSKKYPMRSYFLLLENNHPYSTHEKKHNNLD